MVGKSIYLYLSPLNVRSNGLYSGVQEGASSVLRGIMCSTTWQQIRQEQAMKTQVQSHI